MSFLTPLILPLFQTLNILQNASLEHNSSQSKKASDGITSNLVRLSINLTNAQASAKVVDTASDTVGTILDILA
jgi:hypothetical protein